MNITTCVDVCDVARGPNPLASGKEDRKLTLFYTLPDGPVRSVTLFVGVLLVTDNVLVVVVDLNVVLAPIRVSLLDP